MIFGYVSIMFAILGVFEAWVYHQTQYEEDLYIQIISFVLAVFFCILQFTGG